MRQTTGYPPPLEAPDAIARLSRDEAERLLAQAEAARRDEIDRYWALCLADPDRARQALAGAPPILGDLYHLARHALPPPGPGAIAGLAAATAQLLEVAEVREALAEFLPAPGTLDPVDSFWEPGEVVGLKIVNGEQVCVLRYGGPLFNPGTVPDSKLAAGENWYLVCHAADDGQGGRYEFLVAYAIAGCVDGRWRTNHLDLPSRSDLMRDLDAMETLARRGSLGEEWCDEFPGITPLPTFASKSDPIIAQLRAHRAALRTPAQA